MADASIIAQLSNQLTPAEQQFCNTKEFVEWRAKIMRENKSMCDPDIVDLACEQQHLADYVLLIMKLHAKLLRMEIASIASKPYKQSGLKKILWIPGSIMLIPVTIIFSLIYSYATGDVKRLTPFQPSGSTTKPDLLWYWVPPTKN